MEETSINELKTVPIWINWKLEENADGKKSKVPYSFEGKKTGTNGNYMNDWCNYETAMFQVTNQTADGIGIVLNRFKTGYALGAIDIDHRDLEDPVVQDILQIMNTYAEISPSGNGFHLLFIIDTNDIPEDFTKKYYMKNPQNGIECYIGGMTNRFITFTEDVVEDKLLNTNIDNLFEFLDKYMTRKVDLTNVTECNSVSNLNVPSNNQVIFSTIRNSNQGDKYFKLFDIGDTSDYNNDASSADMALAEMTLYYTGPDIHRVKGIMLQSALRREKWILREDYLDNTIKKAIAYLNGNYFDWSNHLETNGNNCTNQNLTLETITSKELMQAKLKPIVPIIDGLIYPGVTILAGAPKVGKSWLCIDMGLCVSKGISFLGSNTQKCDCLYLDCEDRLNRLQGRMKLVLAGKEASDGFHITTESITYSAGLLSAIQSKINENSNIKLVIIDTFTSVNDVPIKRGVSTYQNEYNSLIPFKRFAEINDIAIVLIHHTRQMKDDNDVFNTIYGSNGINGGLDTMIVLSKENEESNEVKLSIRGRDVEESSKIIQFNTETGKWDVLDKFSDIKEVKQQLEYENDPTVITIRKLVNENPKGVKITASELLEEIYKTTKTFPKSDTPQGLAREINSSLRYKLLKYDNIYYQKANSNGGSGGRKMFFTNPNKHQDEQENIDMENTNDVTE